MDAYAAIPPDVLAAINAVANQRLDAASINIVPLYNGIHQTASDLDSMPVEGESNREVIGGRENVTS